jgi:hypothetical protein
MLAVAVGILLATALPASANTTPAQLSRSNSWRPLRPLMLRLALKPIWRAEYTVAGGDTLSGIATTHCSGHAADWTGIYSRNRAVIGGNPNLITPGQHLVLKCTDPPGLLQLAATPAQHAATTDGDGDHDGDTTDTPAPVAQNPQAATPVAAAAPASAGAPPGSFQACVIQAESGGNASAVNASSGAGGLYGFLPSTWQALGFPGLPENAPVSEQNAAFAKEYAQSGTAPWAPYDGC